MIYRLWPIFSDTWFSQQVFPKATDKGFMWAFFTVMVQKPYQTITRPIRLPMEILTQPLPKTCHVWVCKPQNVWKYGPRKEIQIRVTLTFSDILNGFLDSTPLLFSSITKNHFVWKLVLYTYVCKVICVYMYLFIIKRVIS